MEQWELLEQNPWWDDGSAIERDGKILEFKKSKLGWIPELFTQVDFAHPKVDTFFNEGEIVGIPVSISLSILDNK